MVRLASESTVGLSDAALRLHLGYAAARDMVLRGELRGWKDRRGRYVVDAIDLERVIRAREQPAPKRRDQ